MNKNNAWFKLNEKKEINYKTKLTEKRNCLQN